MDPIAASFNSFIQSIAKALTYDEIVAVCRVSDRCYPVKHLFTIYAEYCMYLKV